MMAAAGIDSSGRCDGFFFPNRTCHYLRPRPSNGKPTEPFKTNPNPTLALISTFARETTKDKPFKFHHFP